MEKRYTVFENAEGVIVVDLAYRSHVGFVVIGTRDTRAAALHYAAMYAEGREVHGYSVAAAIGYASTMSPPAPPPPPLPISAEDAKLVDEVLVRILKEAK